MRGLAAAALVCLLAGPARADDCDGVMAALVAAQTLAQTSLANVDALEAAIAGPSWDPIGDAWMLPALGWAIDEMIEALNTVAVAEARAHEAHCY